MLVFGHLEVNVDTEQTQVEDQITYLYKYDGQYLDPKARGLTEYSFREGRSTSSFGTW